MYFNKNIITTNVCITFYFEMKIEESFHLGHYINPLTRNGGSGIRGEFHF